MLKYFFSFKNPHRHFIDIEFIVSNHHSNELILKLPAWRPGRYELANFAKNIQCFNVIDCEGNPLKFNKINKDTWLVSTPNISDIIVRYNYYANEINAGSSYLDESQLYVNPINCCLYIPNRIDEEHIVDLNIPNDYIIACALKQNKNQLIAISYDDLVESPWIASPSIQHKQFKVNEFKFHIWIQGECCLDWDYILTDFEKFAVEQINDFKSFPVAEYHFLYQILPFEAYHGVEHTSSTVISLGPGHKIMKKPLYNSFLGVSSHELYHTWNVKKIRPKAFMPYDYSKENYSRMGFLYEGVTSYMGDLYLRRSGIFSTKQFFICQEKNLDKHFHNEGRYNKSIADSSFDTWLDGYGVGIPNRKVSIYTEGSLCALMLDLSILKKTNGELSLRDLMTRLYYQYAMKNIGLTEEDYILELIKYGGVTAKEIIENHMYGTLDYRVLLDRLLSYVGLNIIEQDNVDFFAMKMGMKTFFVNKSLEISHVLIGSLADNAKISVGDRILEVNKQKITKKLLVSLKKENSISIKLKRRFKSVDIKISLDDQITYFPRYKIKEIEKKSDHQKLLFSKWLKDFR